MNLSEEQIERFSRHIILEEVGLEGQEKLQAASVLVVGLGGLGSPAALYLSAAGIGTLGFVDSDKVDISNLQRQVIHHTADIGRLKVESAADKARAINPDIDVQTYPVRINADNALEIMDGYDFIIDATDSFESKFLLNDAAYFGRKPLSHGGILRFEGQLMTILPDETACYRCLFHAPPEGDIPNCSQAGVLGVLPGTIGSLQATEAIKYLLNRGDLLTDALLTADLLAMRFRRVNIRRNPECPLCGEHPTIKALEEITRTMCEMKEGQS